MHPFQSLLIALVALSCFASCSTPRPGGAAGTGTDAAQLAGEFCNAKVDLKGVEGRVWMKAKSKETSGQFPAIVKASPEKGLTLEVTQLMGARVALIEIRGTDFKVETVGQGAVSKKARSWGGIPLEWASALFMNQLPCPSYEVGEWRWNIREDGKLEGRLPDGSETWRFTSTQRQGAAFVEKVVRERKGKMDFELTREDPDPQDGWARRWEIKSGVGEVKVRWRDRKAL